MFKKYYNRFLEANSSIQHYTSHAHHYCPDAVLEALEHMDDGRFKKIPETQELIAGILNLSHPKQIVFSSGTHEFIGRLLSGFDTKKTISILSTDSELYRFHQENVEVREISTHPFDDFEERFLKTISESHYDMVFLSQVFFNSGMVIKNLSKIIQSVKDPTTMIVIDGYHGFMAIPTDLKEIEERVFYIAGNAQGGDGCCFMAMPNLSVNCPAQFSPLDRLSDGLCRLHALLLLFKKNNITVEIIHEHIKKMQKNFRDHLLKIDHHYLCEKNILSVDYNHHGHFFAFALPSPLHTQNLHDELRSHRIWTDYTASRLRFGFGPYQNDCIDLMKLKSSR